jgi:hypothetical protein
VALCHLAFLQFSAQGFAKKPAWTKAAHWLIARPFSPSKERLMTLGQVFTADRSAADIHSVTDCLGNIARCSALQFPDTPLVKAAIGRAREVSEPWLFNHVMRSWLFATHVALNRDMACDAEVLAVGSILHDLGLTKQHKALNRFEVDGANAAVELVKIYAPDMDVRRRQLIWDCVALHSTGSIARHKEPEVALVNAGIGVDYAGVGLDHLSEDALAVILEMFPRLAMKDRFCSCLCALASEKPASTHGTWVADFGVRFVEGYGAPSSVDALLSAPYDE